MPNRVVQRWIIKALIQKALSAARLVKVYHFMQRRMGRLGEFNPKARVEYVAKLYQDVQPFLCVRDASFVEIGTGWVPAVPIGLYLLGAKSIDTYDVFCHLQPDLTLASIRQYDSNSRS